MKIKLLLISLVLVLQGCLYQSVNQTELQRSVNICGSVQNISEMTSSALGTTSVTCFNGKKYLVSNGQFKNE